jgi:hypothetical protein
MGRIYFNARKKSQALNAAHTVKATESGTIFMVSNSSGAGYNITLPTGSDMLEGLHYKFIVEEDTPGDIVTIAAGSSIIDGVQKDAGGDAANSTAGTAVDNILIGTTTKQGDYINLFTDGNTWYFECLSSVNNAITTT